MPASPDAQRRHGAELMAMAPAVAVSGVSVAHGALRVLDDVSFDVPAGQVLGIVGPNGAGKTTLLNVMAGAQRADRGRVMLAGVDVSRLAPHRRTRLGLARTFQVPRPMGELTVFEVALVAAHHGGGLRGPAAHHAAADALERAGLRQRANAVSGSLRLLDRKGLELARALAGRPSVLLLDEIAGGLTDAEVAELVAVIGALAATGLTVVWVEHVLRALTQVASHLMCLADGRVLAAGAPADVLASDAVRTAYLGGSAR